MAVTATDVLPEQRLRESFVKHAVRAQLERLFAMIDGGAAALDIFADPAAAAGMIAAARGVPLDGCRIDLQAGGRVDFASADGALSGSFQKGDAVLPRLTALQAVPDTAPRQRLVGHRTRAAIHYFIALVENPGRDPQPFRELLSDRFSLHYTPAPMTDLAALDAWVKGALSSVVASEHDIHAIDVRVAGDGHATADVRMTSQALFPDGSGAISRNSQSWTIVDTPGERFPRVTEILIERDAVEFFGPAPHYEPRERP